MYTSEITLGKHTVNSTQRKSALRKAHWEEYSWESTLRKAHLGKHTGEGILRNI